MSREEVISLIKSDLVRDLHIHTVYSDGVLTPEQVVDRWQEEGRQLIAITDHDGIDGSVAAMEYSKNKDITVISGIEFDSDNELGRNLHILGYGIDFNNEILKNRLEQIVVWRNARNEIILEAIRARGIDITDEEINAVNGGRYVGKPTFARVIVNRGLYHDLASVFNDFFGKDPSIKQIKKQALNSQVVVDAIHAAGGIAVLAHPMEQMKTGEIWEHFEPRLKTILDTFVEYGVEGIECYHPSASQENSEYLLKYAEDHNLLITRGSDFHFDGMNRKYTRD